ncbi:MAG: filamentous hemagglutinin N-terminal domain-containing protein [Cyanobacteria bacterium P01_F01_bin.150]
MSVKCFIKLLPLLGLFLLLLLGQSSPAVAQVIPDTTLGMDASQLQRQGNRLVIKGGSDRAPVLFHSFEQFSVAENQQVFFANPQGIDSIISRVTGDTPSDIDGILGIAGPADLFLLNPNSIVFGPNAQLDIAGSFTASTADSIRIDDFDFSAANPNPVPLLTLKVTPGIQLGSNAPNRLIQNNGTLSLGRRQALTFNADTINQAGQIRIPAGTVQLQGETLRLTGTVDTRAGGEKLGKLQVRSPSNLIIQSTGPLTNQAISDALETNEVVVESDRTLTLVGPVNSHSPASLTLTSGNNLNLLDDGTGTVSSLNGNVTLQSNQDIRITNPLFVSVTQGIPQFTIQAVGKVILQPDRTPPGPRFGLIEFTGNGGELSLQANRLTASDTGNIFTFASGNWGPTIDITVNQDLTLEASAIGTRAGFGQTAGNIQIQAGQSVELLDSAINSVPSMGATVQSTGHINIHVGDTLLVQSSLLQTQSTGNAGNINLVGRHILVDGTLGQSLLATDTQLLSLGDAGNITLNATESVELAGDLPGPFIFPDAQQLGLDNILFQAFGNTTIQSSAFGNGRSGTIQINTEQLRLRDGVLIVNAAGLSETSEQPSGDILITAKDIQMQGPAFIGTGTIGDGDAGRLEIQSDRISLDEGAAIGVSTVLGNGNAGNLIIDTQDLTVSGGSVIAANTAGGGNGGILEIRAHSVTVEGTSEMDENGNIFPSTLLTDASSMATGSGGELLLQTDRLQVLDGGQIRASTEGPEDAGNINIQATAILISGSSPEGIVSTIETQATNPDGVPAIGSPGVLQLNGEQLVISDRAQLNTESESGDGGNIVLGLDRTLVLQRQGQISATAGTAEAGGNGGNIEIDAGFVIAPGDEDSDITANAFAGMGGNINIRTNGLLLGIAVRDRPTPLTSDITASSELGVAGTVTVSGITDELAPSPIQLPSRLADANNQLIVGCLLDEDASFVVTGRGGIPATPTEMLNQQVLIWQDDRPLGGNIPEAVAPTIAVSTSEHTLEPSINSRINGIPNASIDMEAQGWQVNGQGQLELLGAIDQRAIMQAHRGCH